jgi:hypothetical protein
LTTMTGNPSVAWLGVGRERIDGAEPTRTVVTSTSAAGLESPVIYGSAESAYFNRGLMRAGRPYPVTLGGVELVAVRNRDDSISFYSVPDAQ